MTKEHPSCPECPDPIMKDNRHRDGHDKCLRCGRGLRAPESRKRGYGNTCYQKLTEAA